jgi:hypothetical protein
MNLRDRSRNQLVLKGYGKAKRVTGGLKIRHQNNRVGKRREKASGTSDDGSTSMVNAEKKGGTFFGVCA